MRIIPTSLFFILLSLAFSGVAHADGHEEAAESESGTAPVFAPLEIYACNYNKGMDRSDLDKVLTKWNAWMDETKHPSYSAWIYSAYYGSPDYSFDFAWLGAWPDGNAMGKSHDEWLANGGEHIDAFAKVADCNAHSNMVATQMRKTDRRPGDTAVLTFADCKVKEDSTMKDVMEGIYAWNAHEAEQGSKGNEWIFFPVYGADADFHFKWVTAHPNYTELGADYERYANGGGWQKAQELLTGKVDCGQSRVYNAERVRDGAPAESAATE